MGNKQAHAPLKVEELSELSSVTRFQQRELRQLYKQFASDTPTGQIPKSEFIQLASLMGLSNKFIAEIVFNAFDRGRAGSVNFSDTVTVLSKITRGTGEDKLEVAFTMLDVKRAGFITREDVITVLTNMRQILPDTAADPTWDPHDIAERFFQQCDRNRDGRITLEEYKSGAMASPLGFALTQF